MWKVTLSKSETIWSIEVGVALVDDQYGWGGFERWAVGRTQARSGPSASSQ